MEFAPAPVSWAAGVWVSQAALSTPPGADDVHMAAVVVACWAAFGVELHGRGQQAHGQEGHHGPDEPRSVATVMPPPGGGGRWCWRTPLAEHAGLLSCTQVSSCTAVAGGALDQAKYRAADRSRWGY